MRNRFFILVLFVLTLFVNNVYSADPIANGSVSGIVVDAKTNQPVEYASMAIFNSKDSSLVNGTITNHEGKFKVDGIRAGNYYISISFIGYETLTLSNISLAANEQKNLGAIKLSPSDQQIDEVEVTAKKNFVEYKIDKKVVNVATSINADNGSAADALENVPSVDVDIDGNVTLRGSSSFTVLIDGKPTALSADEILKQTPAALVENIEIITNPSAKYDPEGSSGIINLVMKKNRVQGVNGVVNLAAGNQGRYGGDFMLNFRKNKINYFVGGHYNMRGFNFNSVSNRETYNTDYTKFVNQSTHNERRFGGGGLKAGLDYYVTDNDIISITAETGIFGSEMDGKNSYDNWYEQLPEHNIYDEEYVFSIEDNEDDVHYVNGSVSYQHNFSKTGHKINFNGFYSFDNRDEEQNLGQNVFNDVNKTDLKLTSGHQIFNNRDNNRARINIDYTLPITEETKFEAGMQGEYTMATTDYDYYDLKSDAYVVNDEFTNDVKFKRYITALYSTFATTLGGFGFQVGLRGEYTYRLVAASTDYDINRLDLFPSLHISRNLSHGQSLQLGYSRRIRRPWENFLNPYPMYSDEYTRRIGNPELKPEYSDAVELNYQKNFEKAFLALETYYRHTTGRMEDVNYLSDGDILISRFENLSDNNSFGAEFSANIDPFKWFNINANINVQKYYISGSYNGEDLSEEGSSWRTKETFSFTPTKNTKFQINMRYRGKDKTLIASNKGNFEVGAALRQSIWGKRITLSADIRDIFKSRRNSSTTITDTYKLFSKRYRDAPVYSFGISYKINNYKDKFIPDSGDASYGTDQSVDFE